MTETTDFSTTFQNEIEKIVAGDVFSRSRANRELLQFLARECSAGRGGAINEYFIAQEFLKKGSDFDPAEDPLVRVRMQRLRKALAEHYEKHPVVEAKIVLPKGQYVVSMETVLRDEDGAQSEQTTDRRGRPERGVEQSSGPPSWRQAPLGRVVLLSAVMAAGLLAAVAGLALMIFGAWPSSERDTQAKQDWQRKSSYPVVAIAPFDNLTEDPEHDIFKTGFQRQLASDFQRFDRAHIKVVAALGVDELIGTDYLLTGRILNLENEVDIALELSESTTGKMVAAHRIALSENREGYAKALRDVSRKISGQFNGQGGVISDVVNMRLDAALGLPNQETIGLFRCVVLSDAFLFNQSLEHFNEAYSCFEDHIGELPDDPIASAAWGTLRLHAVPELNYMDTEFVSADKLEDLGGLYEYASTLARAYPSVDHVHVFLGSVHIARGEAPQSLQALEHAVELNPGNSTNRVMLAFAYLANDRLEDAANASQQVVSEMLEPKPFHYMPMMIAALATDDTTLAGIAYEGMRGATDPVACLVIFAAASFLDMPSEQERLRAFFEREEMPLAALQRVLPGDKGYTGVTSKLGLANISQ